jgi:hypothetical protein
LARARAAGRLTCGAELEDLVLGEPRLEPHCQERLIDFALDRAFVGEEQVLGELLRNRRAALHHAAGPRIGGKRAKQAGNIDAEMLVEAPVLGRQHRLDQVVGKLFERDRIVVADAARADLVAVAVEEGDGELGFLEPVLVRGVAERRDRERQQHHEAAGAQRRPLGKDFDRDAPPASDVEPVHEGREALVVFPRPGPGAEHRRIDARIEVEQEALKPRLPVVGKQLAQSPCLSLRRTRRPPDGPSPLFLADPSRGGQHHVLTPENGSNKIGFRRSFSGLLPQRAAQDCEAHIG